MHHHSNISIVIVINWASGAMNKSTNHNSSITSSTNIADDTNNAYCLRLVLGNEVCFAMPQAEQWLHYYYYNDIMALQSTHHGAHRITWSFFEILQQSTNHGRRCARATAGKPSCVYCYIA